MTPVLENEWVSVVMRADLGRKNCTWTLTLTRPDGSTQTFTDLPCHPAWQSARWVGFISLSPGTASFYLDDVVMENRDSNTASK